MERVNDATPEGTPLPADNCKDVCEYEESASASVLNMTTIMRLMILYINFGIGVSV